MNYSFLCSNATRRLNFSSIAFNKSQDAYACFPWRSAKKRSFKLFDTFMDTVLSQFIRNFILHVVFKDQDAALNYWEDGEFYKGVKDSFTMSTKAIFSQFKPLSSNVIQAPPVAPISENRDNDSISKPNDEVKVSEEELVSPTLKDIFQSKLVSFYEDAIMTSKKSRHDVR